MPATATTFEITCPDCDAPIAVLESTAPALRSLALRCRCGATARLDAVFAPPTNGAPQRTLRPRPGLLASLEACKTDDARLRVLAGALDQARKEAQSAADRADAIQARLDAVRAKVLRETGEALHAARSVAPAVATSVAPALLRDAVNAGPSLTDAAAALAALRARKV